MDTFVQIAGYTEATCALVLMAAIAIGSWFSKSDAELDKDSSETEQA
jgi:hypothetical protein